MPSRDKITAAAVALLLHAAIIAALVAAVLRFPPDDSQPWPPQEDSAVAMDELEELYDTGEYVRTGDLDTPAPDTDAAPSAAETATEPQAGPDAADAGAKGDPAPPLTSAKETAAKETAKPKGPTKEQLEAEKKRQEAQARQQAQKAAEAATAKAFGGKGQGTQGQTDGTSATTGSFAGKPGNGLKGRTAEHWGSVRSTKTGTIAIRVRVNSQGQVTSAVYDPTRSSGAAAADTGMRQRCVQASKQSRFSVLEGSPEASGLITWKFE